MNLTDYISLVLGVLGAFLLIGIALAIPAGRQNGWVSILWALGSSAAVIWALNTLGVLS